VGYALAGMPKPKPKRSPYLADLREQRGLKPAEVLKKLRAGGVRLPRSNFNRWETGQRHCPVWLQWELAKIYQVPLVTVLQHTEGLPKDVSSQATIPVTASNENAGAAPLGEIRRMPWDKLSFEQQRAILYLESLPEEDWPGLRRAVEHCIVARRAGRESSDRASGDD